MGCGQTKHASGDNYRSDAADDSNDELEASTAASLQSSKSITTVTSTRGRVASSSQSMPYLADPVVSKSPAPASHDSAPPTSPHVDGSPAGSGDLQSPSLRKASFSIGDLTMDPEDVNRQRRERINRRFSTSSSISSSGSFHSSSATAGPASHGGSFRNSRAGAPNGMAGGFRMHDVVVDDDLEDPFGLAAEPVRHNDHWVRSARSRTLHGLPRRVKGLAVVPGGDLFLCSVADSEVVVVRGRKSDNEVRRHPDWRSSLRKAAAMDRVAAIAVDPSGERFATIAADGTCVVRDVDSDSSGEGAPQVMFPDDEASGGYASCVAFCGSRRLLVGDTHGRVRVWSLGDNPTSVSAQLHGVNGPRSKAAVNVLACSPSSDMCVTAGQDGCAHIIDASATELSPVATYAGHDGRSIKFGGLISKERAVTVCDRAAHIWGVADGAPCFVYDLTGLSHSQVRTSSPARGSPGPTPKSKGLSSLSISRGSPSGSANDPNGAGKLSPKDPSSGPCSIWVARVALFGPTGSPRSRIVTTGCVVDADEERVVICIADTFGEVTITPLPLSSNACRCPECSGVALHFRSPVAVVAPIGKGAMLAGDGFGNLYEVKYL